MNILPKSYTEEEEGEEVVFGTTAVGADVGGVEVDATGSAVALPDVAGWRGSVSDLESPPLLLGGERLELKNSERGPLLK